MLSSIKKRLYFVVAAYFGFWAKIVLRRWHPRVVVITGSSGKTTVLHLIEAQFGAQAIYSHHANSALGLPFFILGMPPNISSKPEWLLRLLFAPFHSLRKAPARKLFIVEADCDRPHEGQFLGDLLKPEVTLWISVFRTHSMNFDGLVKSGAFATHEEAIAHEFGYFAANTKKLVIANGDQLVLAEQLKRVKSDVKVELTSDKAVVKHQLLKRETAFTFAHQKILLNGLHPRELGGSLQMVNKLLAYLGQPLDETYQHLEMPPGRTNVFAGKRGITIVDSTYNTGLGATIAIIKLFEQYSAREKWLVLGDILEQGSLEAEEHEGLAQAIADTSAHRVILLGPRTQAHTLPLLRQLKSKLTVVSFESPKEVLDYLNTELTGGETLLFKGGRFLEGVIEQLLANPNDAQHLVRRGHSWVKRRQKWGLPR